MKADLQITVPPATQRLLRGGAPTVVLPAIARALDRENELTLGVATEKRFSFPRTGPATPEGLRVQTNRLRRSLTRAAARTEGTSVISAIGSNVRYFGIHEFGFQGTVAVRAHSRRESRRFQAGDGSIISLALAARLGALTQKGALRRGTVVRELDRRTHAVRAHERRVDQPARRMVARTVEERQANYAATLAAEVARAVTGGPA